MNNIKYEMIDDLIEELKIAKREIEKRVRKEEMEKQITFTPNQVIWEFCLNCRSINKYSCQCYD